MVEVDSSPILRAEDIAALTPLQFEILARLQVTDRQAFHGRSFQESIEDWQTAERHQVLGLCFLLGDEPVGMALFKRRGRNPRERYAKVASIHGLKIALPWQGKGWGHIALRLAVRSLKENWPNVAELVLSVDADNYAAIAVYRGFGMEDSGPVFEGQHGPEHHFRLLLNS